MNFNENLKALDKCIMSNDKAQFEILMSELQPKYKSNSIESIELILKQLQFNFMYEFNFKKLEGQFAEKKEQIIKYGSIVQRIRLYSNLGVIKTQLSETEEALDAYNKALELCTVEETNRLLMGINSNIGAIYNDIGDHGKALKHLILAYNYSQLYNQHENRAIYRILTNIGTSYMSINEYSKAINYFTIALDTVSVYDLSVPLPLLYNNITSAYILNGELQKAKEYLDKFEQIEFETHSHFHIVHNRNQGSYLLHIGNYKEAFDQLISMVEQVKQRENIKDQLQYFSLIMECCLELNDYDTFKTYLNMVDEKIGTNMSMKFTELRIRYYQETGDIQKALDCSKEYNEYLIKKQTEVMAFALEDITSALSENHDCIAISAYQDKLQELKYLNYVLEEDKSMLLGNLSSLKEEKELRDKMISIIIHDVRGPIGNANQLLSLIPDIEYESERTVIMQSISDSMQNTHKLTDDLINWAREVISGLESSIMDVRIHDCIQEIAKLFRDQLQSKNISINNTISSDVTIKGDLRSLKTVFRNIIQNAIKYSTQGSTITLSESIQPDKLVFSISDTGVGMSKDKAEHLFDSSNVSTLGTNGEQGTGIGMLLIKELVTKNNGSIRCLSAQDQGTTFELSFPLKSNYTSLE